MDPALYVTRHNATRPDLTWLFRCKRFFQRLSINAWLEWQLMTRDDSPWLYATLLARCKRSLTPPSTSRWVYLYFIPNPILFLIILPYQCILCLITASHIHPFPSTSYYLSSLILTFFFPIFLVYLQIILHLHPLALTLFLFLAPSYFLHFLLLLLESRNLTSLPIKDLIATFMEDRKNIRRTKKQR